ncbi:Type I restriction-modification system methyltransferase subunit-like protein (plasmid) [Xylanimonas cellulosilytica DSM 15894]|uniref:Type I restriction-modification system methyltransferase subunit-like protein n=1 Tax=Xylanimonas cellulosilytica (strain DSM 15894 / JCM 12276 / CECT 5975 / KCTC 9989 / LMG 20990 / NBRC 107835 / XIL07) TaxID=446471 RepID=D1C0R8_XYLCX|nr:N-6 DNA methylase [Xylanimonas cellulosilytica]ACZ32384.1 Type I restriction-modification system methyltransferase subunit-like protein [Xylanimonas cellulosilytica DSM 15894]
MGHERLAKSLHQATARYGASGYLIALTALATANVLLGAPTSLLAPTLRRLAEPERVVGLTRGLWEATTGHFGYLAGRVDAISGWLETAGEHEVRALAACFEVLAGVELHASFDEAGGDLLGPVYMSLRGLSSQQAAGAFYTPPDLSVLIGAMTMPREGAHVMEPCCGAGGMVLGVVKAMRQAGADPDTCTWVLNDLDPVAVALAGVNLAAHGLSRVVLCVGDGLLLGTGLDGDPLEAAAAAPGSQTRPRRAS